MNWKTVLCQIAYAAFLTIVAQIFTFKTMVIVAFAQMIGYLLAKDLGLISPQMKPTTEKDGKDGEDDDCDTDYMTRFYVIDFGDGKFGVSRSKMQKRDGRLLTRRELFADDMELAQFFFCKEYMCCSWDPPYGGVKGDRPTKEWWLAQPPYEFEVDTMLSTHIFKDKAYISG